MSKDADAGEVERLRHIVDRDRYVVAIGLEAIRRAIGGHNWLLEGRGPYAWDDDDYRREFGAAIANVEAALPPLALLASDKTDCTTDSVKVQEARDAARQFLAALTPPANRDGGEAEVERQVEAAFREGFNLGDFAGGGNADPATEGRAWNNSRARAALAERAQ